MEFFAQPRLRRRHSVPRIERRQARFSFDADSLIKVRQPETGQDAIAAAWKVKPCWFIITADDRVVSAELQRVEAERMAARVTVLRASHMSLLSQPDEVVTVMEEAAEAVNAMTAA